MNKLRLIVVAGGGLSISLSVLWFFSRPAINQKQLPLPEKQKSVRQSPKGLQSPKQNSKAAHPTPKSKEDIQVSKRENQGIAISENKPKGVPQTAGEVMERLLSEIENSSDQKINRTRVLARLQELQDFGEEGSKVILAFLKTNEDIVLNEYFIQVHRGGDIQTNTLRVALLDTLYGMNDPTAQAANLKVLETTPFGYEALIAARNLEKNFPGVYRTEALNAVSEILAKAANFNGQRGQLETSKNSQILEIVGYYQAREMIPQIEDLVKKQPELLDSWMQCLSQFPSEDQSSVYIRLFGQEEVRKEVIAKKGTFFLYRFDYGNDRLRRLAYDIFTGNLSSVQKLYFISNLVGVWENTGPQFFAMGPEQPRQLPGHSNKTKADADGLFKFLDEIEPTLDTPELKTNLENARKKLNNYNRRSKMQKQ